MSTLKAFDPTRAKCVIALNDVTGWAPDTKFTITPTNPRKTVTTGVDNDISVNIDSRYVGTLELNLLQNAEFNSYLQYLNLGGDAANFPFFPVSIADPTSDYYLDTVGWIETEADHSVAQETGTKTWIIGLQDTRGKSSRPQSIGQFILGV